ncbi:MSRE protein, partial [Polypterus senegalus]
MSMAIKLLEVKQENITLKVNKEFATLNIVTEDLRLKDWEHSLKLNNITLIQGPIGPRGEKDNKGDKGDDGLKGQQGIQGSKGEKGDQGEINDKAVVRLKGGHNVNSGRVEVFYAGQWGTICDDKWDINDGMVICRMLGYKSALNVHFRALFGEVYATTTVSDVSVREMFYLKLRLVVDGCLWSDTTLVMGDFSATTGTDRAGYEDCASPHGSGDHGERG